MNQVTNLSELLDTVRDTSFGKTTDEVFRHLQEIVGSVNIRYEICNADPDTVPKRDATSARRGKFEHLNTADIGRVLLTSDRNRADFTRELHSQCNGVVFDYTNWKVLSVPPKMFNPIYKSIDFVANVSDYDVYDINDGTLVTLYWYPSVESADEDESAGRWCMSTTNGYDVGDYRWMGDATYTTAFAEVLTDYPKFDFDNLNKTKSYTVGFRHEDFHHFTADPRRAWFVQSCDLHALNTTGELNISTTEDIGIPPQTIIDLSAMKPGGLMRWINRKNERARVEYIKGKDKVIHYGFIFRSRGSGCDIMMESTLLTSIRKLMYELPKSQSRYKHKITPANRLQYTVLRAYLYMPTKAMFLNLFPQFESTFIKYDGVIKTLRDRLVSNLRSCDRYSDDGSRANDTKRGGNRTSTNNTNTAGDQLDIIQSACMDNMVRQLTSQIRKTVRVNAMDVNGPSIIYDFIMQPRHLSMYYNYITMAV